MARKTEQHSYYTEEKWNKVNEDNKQLINDFLNYLRSIDRSPETVKSYENDLQIYFLWNLENNKNKFFIDVKKKDVVNYQNWMIHIMKLSPSRVRRLKSAISSLSNYIVDILDEEYSDFKNIINKIKPPQKQEVREKTVLKDEQVEFLINYLVDKKQYVKACFVACLAASAVRKSEIVQFRVSFINEEKLTEDGFYVTPEIRCKGAGVRGLQKNKYIIKEIMKKYFDLWMEEREKLGIDNEELFVIKRKGIWKPISNDTVDSWMQTFSKILNEDCYAHCFRHYSATWLKRNGASIEQIQEFLGHSSSEVTQIYIDIGAEESLKGMLNFLKKPETEEKADDNE